MALTFGLYLVTDVLVHKGQTRVLLPASYADLSMTSLVEKPNATLINSGKHWKKAVNTLSHINNFNQSESGFECDVYFDIKQNKFEVHHDWDKPSGFYLDDILIVYQQRKLTASLWLDFKNLNDANAYPALLNLLALQNKFNLKHKILVESKRPQLLNQFSDSGFYTSYYTPMFNPYQIEAAKSKLWADSISAVLQHCKVNALSGYYFQYPFLKNYFSEKDILIWAANDRFSLVNWLFIKKISADSSVFIALYP